MIAETVAITASNRDIGYIQRMTNISAAQLHFWGDVYNQVKISSYTPPFWGTNKGVARDLQAQ